MVGALRSVSVVCPFGINFDNSEYEKFALENGKTIIYDFIDAFPFCVNTSFPICYSFAFDKLLNIGEGGAILFNSSAEKYRARVLCNFEDPGNGNLISDRGYNGRLARREIVQREIDWGEIDWG